MKNKKVVSIFTVLLLFYSQLGFSQKIFYLGIGDSIKNMVGSHRGTIQWQYSTDNALTWNNYQDQKSKNDNYVAYITGSVMIRAKISEGNCDIYSDTTTVYSTVSDYDNNVYPIKKIGKYVWITENLRTTHYNNGDPIPLVSDSNSWANLTTPAYCNIRDITYSDSIKIYGRLYNWFAVGNGNLCPTGWHVPSDNEWYTFSTYLMYNGYNYDGTTSNNNVAKSLASTSIPWTFSQTMGAPGNLGYPQKQNITQFSAIPVGFRFDLGVYIQFSEIAVWWTSTSISSTTAWMRIISYDNPSFTGMDDTKSYGLSVRCIKD